MTKSIPLERKLKIMYEKKYWKAVEERDKLEYALKEIKLYLDYFGVEYIVLDVKDKFLVNVLSIAERALKKFEENRHDS